MKPISLPAKHWRSRNPEAYRAHNILNSAVRRGKIAKPGRCENGCLTNKIIGHHDNYALPLFVRWLCHKCHRIWHKSNEAVLT